MKNPKSNRVNGHMFRVKVVLSVIWRFFDLKIAEYIRNQLQDDIAGDQISLFEAYDPFTGAPNVKCKNK